MEQDFFLKRKKELAKYPTDLPIFLFLRQCKTTDIRMFEEILFYFGEIDLDDKIDGETVSWYTDLKNMMTIKVAFETICPKGRLETTYYSDDLINFRLKWKNENDIHPVIFNKIIFPDFCIVPKKDLDF